MSSVVGDISMSLDGVVAGEVDGLESLHTWALTSSDPVDVEVLSEVAAAGAVLMGRRTFDVVDGRHGWRDGLGYAAHRDARPPFVVVTARPPERVRLAATHDFSFARSARDGVELARTLAGSGDVFAMGGAQMIRSCLAEGLLDQLHLHLAPEVLGAGTSLFDGSRHRLARRDVRVSSAAVHLVLDVQGRRHP